MYSFRLEDETSQTKNSRRLNIKINNLDDETHCVWIFDLQVGFYQGPVSKLNRKLHKVRDESFRRIKLLYIHTTLRSPPNHQTVPKCPLHVERANSIG